MIVLSVPSKVMSEFGSRLSVRSRTTLHIICSFSKSSVSSLHSQMHSYTVVSVFAYIASGYGTLALALPFSLPFSLRFALLVRYAAATLLFDSTDPSPPKASSSFCLAASLFQRLKIS
jgi:hypothetical protein